MALELGNGIFRKSGSRFAEVDPRAETDRVQCFLLIGSLRLAPLSCARLRNAERIIGPLTGFVSRLFLYTSAIIRPVLKLPSTIEFLKDLLGGDARI